MSVSEEPNDYVVRTQSGPGGWEVQILDPDGHAVWSRPCGDESEARTFASTVKQHIYWLSPAKFREYYRLAKPA
jgi:hypothetical protein